jgi:hypothetical protein
MPMTSEYVTAMVKGGENGFAIKAGDATTGTLTTMFDGPRPNGYQPMKKQGVSARGGAALLSCGRALPQSKGVSQVYATRPVACEQALAPILPPLLSVSC